MQVQIGGEPVTLGEFSAFKAFRAMEIIANAQQVFRAVLSEAADFKREYEAEHFVVIPRAEARRSFPPRPLVRVVREEIGDDRLAFREEPVLDDDGAPVLGPDPLGHLTDDDWKASGNELRIADSPSERLQWASMIPKGFKLGRVEVLRLLALVTTSNRELEAWDGEKDIDAELDRVAKDLLHRSRAGELVALAAAALELCKAEISDPFDQLVESVRTTFTSEADPETTDSAPATAPPPPMTVEHDSTPPSSSTSPDGSDGRPTSSSTEPAFASSSLSEGA